MLPTHFVEQTAIIAGPYFPSSLFTYTVSLALNGPGLVLTETLFSATWSACPINFSTPPSAYYIHETQQGSQDSKEKSEPDPRAFIAIARMNWLHSHYSIACPPSLCC